MLILIVDEKSSNREYMTEETNPNSAIDPDKACSEATTSERSMFPNNSLSSVHNRDDVYKYKFTIGLFWMSQICALLIVVIFVSCNLNNADGFEDGGYKTWSVLYAAGASATILLSWLLLGLVFSKLFRIRTPSSAIGAVVGFRESKTKIDQASIRGASEH